MSYDEYWNGDPKLVRAYREAEKQRLRMRNWEMWLNGRYTYEAIMNLIPSLQLWKPKPPLEYMSEPYPLTKDEYYARLEREEKAKQQQMKDYLMGFANRHNKKIEEDNNE